MNGNILKLGLLVAALELFSACAPLPPPIERQSSGAFSGSWESFTYGKREALMVDTNLREDDKPIHLQVILVKPNGDGPFPLAVFNHGSTGRGTDPRLFSQTWYNAVLAEFFVKKGWVVAFPQRRGRGKSNGLYDEGFRSDRSAGYSCNPNESLPGADRALTDIQAAIAALKRRGDIDPKRVLLGGTSRGGVLAIAYAGENPDGVIGVINFVGGWTGERCGTASEINGSLFRRGGKYNQPTLWLYGKGDRFYSIEHSRSNFEVFRKAGGEGEFIAFDVPNTMPNTSGHDVIRDLQLWEAHVEKYLSIMQAGEKK